MNYRARLYDPKLGRFISADSIVPNATDPQEFNRYSYVNNNPIKFTDPTGHKKKKWWKKLLSIFVGINVGVATFVLTGGNIPASFAAGFAAFRATDAALNGANFQQTLAAGVRGAIEGYLIGKGFQAGFQGSGSGPPVGARVVNGTKAGSEVSLTESFVSNGSGKAGGLIDRIIGTTLAYAGEAGKSSNDSTRIDVYTRPAEPTPFLHKLNYDVERNEIWELSRGFPTVPLAGPFGNLGNVTFNKFTGNQVQDYFAKYGDSLKYAYSTDVSAVLYDQAKALIQDRLSGKPYIPIYKNSNCASDISINLGGGTSQDVGGAPRGIC